MPESMFRAVLIAATLAAGTVAAQPAPPPPPTPPRHIPSAAPSAAPVVKPKPGPAAHHPSTKPPTRHAPAVVHAPVTAPAVVPTPAPTAAVPAPEAEKESEPAKGSNTGNPLPRFATLRSDEVNLRTGPGTRYPIDWVYKRRDLPVVIEREFEVWRLVRDPEGVKGWVHQATLAPRRTGVVIGGEQALRTEPKDTAPEVARLKPGVIVRLRSCEATSDWCQGQVQDYRGWIKRSQFWGTLPGEAIQ